MKKIITLALFVMSFFAAQTAWGTNNHYYGSILKVQTSATGAGTVYAVLGTVANTSFVTIVNVDEEKILANGAPDVYYNKQYNGAITSYTTPDEDPTTGATISYGVGIVVNDGYEFLGWVNEDGETISTDLIFDAKLHSSTYLGYGQSLTNPNAETEGYYDVLLTAQFVDSATGLNAIDAKQVTGVKYVDLSGRTSDTPFDGVNIVVTNYADGTHSTAKVLK